MRILKISDFTGERKKKCPKCKIVLLYEKTDILMGDNPKDMNLYIVCPVCEASLKVSKFDKVYNPYKDR